MQNLYTGDRMKRFILLLLMLFIISNSAFAQTGRPKFMPQSATDTKGSAATISAPMNDAHNKGQAAAKSTLLLQNTHSAVQSGVTTSELDKSSPEYIKLRMHQLEAALYEKVRDEVIKEKAQPEMSGLTAEPAFYDEREVEKANKISSFDAKAIDKEVELRLETEVLLKNFGKDFFEQGEISEGTLFSGAAPSNYLLGPGDELKIIVWSEMGDETVYDVQVNPEGQVYVPILGVLGVAGITAGEFEQMVIGRLAGKFAHFKGQVTLTKVRTMQIFVVGEVERPGAMTISGLGTAFTALYQAGGPTVRGSMRSIKILDTKGTAKEIDLYRYLLSGDRSQDMPLKNGDTVFVPAVGSLVKIAGMVTRPAIYEIMPNTSLQDALLMAGNVQANAYAGRVKITRWTGDKRRRTFDVSINDGVAIKNFMIMNGDEIKVERATEIIGNNVSIEGAVTRPGDYAYTGGLKVADLIKRAGGMIAEEANLEHGQIYRKTVAGQEEVLPFNVKFALLDDKDHNLDLNAMDRVRLYAEKDITPDTRLVTVDGAVRRPGQYVYRDGMRLADLIVNARGLALDAAGQVEVARIKDGQNNELIRADINKALAVGSSVDNIVLKPLDKVSVLVRGDRLMEAEVVTLKGQVKFPGPYALEYRGETLSSVIKRAGGLTGNAFADGAVFMRRIESISSEHQLETAENVQSEMFRQATLDLRADLLRAGAKLDSLQDVRSDMQASTVDQKMLDINNTGAKDALANQAGYKGTTGETSTFGGIEMRSRALDSQMVRIPLPLQEIVDGKAEAYEDVALLDGDQITIPVLPKTVSVLGAVINPTTILYSNNRDARYYINRAGGFSPHSDHRRTVIIKANGEVMPMRSVRKLGRGDIVLVPPKPKLIRPDKLKEFGNIAGILGNLAVTYKVVNDSKK